MEYSYLIIRFYFYLYYVAKEMKRNYLSISFSEAGRGDYTPQGSNQVIDHKQDSKRTHYTGVYGVVKR